MHRIMLIRRPIHKVRVSIPRPPARTPPFNSWVGFPRSTSTHYLWVSVGSKARTPSEHPNPNSNWVVHLPQNGIPLASPHSQMGSQYPSPCELLLPQRACPRLEMQTLFARRRKAACLHPTNPAHEPLVYSVALNSWGRIAPKHPPSRQQKINKHGFGLPSLSPFIFCPRPQKKEHGICLLVYH